MDNVAELYGMIGERLKHVFMGCQAWILSYRDECFDHIGLRPKTKLQLMNGELACEYRGYELFAGTNKDYRKAQNEAPPARRFERTERPERKERSERPARNTFTGKPRLSRLDLDALRRAIDKPDATAEE